MRQRCLPGAVARTRLAWSITVRCPPSSTPFSLQTYCRSSCWRASLGWSEEKGCVRNVPTASPACKAARRVQAAAGQCAALSEQSECFKRCSASQTQPGMTHGRCRGGDAPPPGGGSVAARRPRTGREGECQSSSPLAAGLYPSPLALRGGLRVAAVAGSIGSCASPAGVVARVSEAAAL